MEYVTVNKFQTKDEAARKEKLMQIAKEIIKEHLKRGRIK